MEVKCPASSIVIGDMVTKIGLGRHITIFTPSEPVEVIQHSRLDDGSIKLTLATPGMNTVICPAAAYVTIKLTR